MQKPTAVAQQTPATPPPSPRRRAADSGSPVAAAAAAVAAAGSGSPPLTLFQVAAMKGMAHTSATKAKAETHKLTRHKEEQHTRRMPWELQPTQVTRVAHQLTNQLDPATSSDKTERE